MSVINNDSIAGVTFATYEQSTTTGKKFFHAVAFVENEGEQEIIVETNRMHANRNEAMADVVYLFQNYVHKSMYNQTEKVPMPFGGAKK